MKSACGLLLYRTYFETWRRGEKYAAGDRVKIVGQAGKSIRAEVKGTKTYKTELAFRSGGLSRSCSCPVRDLCKHMVAVAIVWDEQRSFKRPTQEDIERNPSSSCKLCRC